MRRTCLALFAACLVPVVSNATWSIIVLDPRTRQAGIAGASCTDYVAGIAGYVPGKGAVVAQAASNWEAKSRAEALLRENKSPAEILVAITDRAFDSAVERQQYGIVSFDHLDQPATFSGAETTGFSGARTGSGYAVQGNMLPGAQVLEAAESALLSARTDGKSLEEVLLRALEAGAAAGGDKRCGKQRATSAFVLVISADLPWWEPQLSVNVHHLPAGGANAVTILREEFRQLRKRFPAARSAQWVIGP